MQYHETPNIKDLIMQPLTICLTQVWETIYHTSNSNAQQTLVAWGVGCTAEPYTYTGGHNYREPALGAKSVITLPNKRQIIVTETLENITAKINDASQKARPQVALTL